MTAINERPVPGDLITHAFELINSRGSDYDTVSDINQNYREIAAVASVIIGKTLTARDVALVMASVKLIRSKSAPEKLDNYIDSMNYMAFAACFTGLVPIPPLGGKPVRLAEMKPPPASKETHAHPGVPAA